ncbi:hypothetical protein LOC67_19475 [Stieleria sp. JC731]|uniref:hypothetical protein n=1 Tax=Pirellulaceae TaxID=2691357 RepID=UPI001E60845D|nr:hypothetical protein [Stieleria sp. JC731]MCC9602736.1 hypothetical protein [Stieleria sp. JC731]
MCTHKGLYHFTTARIHLLVLMVVAANFTALPCIVLATETCDDALPAQFCDGDQSDSSLTCTSEIETWMLTEPVGDLHPRYPYDAMQLDYYHRPYSPHHVSQHYGQPSFAETKHPYQTRHLKSIYAEIEKEVIDIRPETLRRASTETTEQILKKDRPLEFVDWRDHERARVRWERQQEGRSSDVHAFDKKKGAELILGTKVKVHEIRSQIE